MGEAGQFCPAAESALPATTKVAVAAQTAKRNKGVAILLRLGIRELLLDRACVKVLRPFRKFRSLLANQRRLRGESSEIILCQWAKSSGMRHPASYCTFLDPQSKLPPGCSCSDFPTNPRPSQALRSHLAPHPRVTRLQRLVDELDAPVVRQEGALHRID